MDELQQTINILIAALGVYGVATLVTEYSGPFNVFDRLRKTKVSGVFECNICLTPYLAIIPAFGLSLGMFGYFAVVGLSIILGRNL